ncbi:MAG: sugar ABC transporter substrate-binding protein [Beutenbergiaceae bacterium]
MKSRKAVWLAAAATTAGLLLAACSPATDTTESDTESGSNESSEHRIGFMIWNTSVPFYSGLISAAEETADELGVELEIRNGDGEMASQIAVVQQFIAEDFDIILLSPGDPTGIVPAIREANDAGIPVMTVNLSADTSTGADVVTYVGVDDVEFGRIQGRLLVEAIGEEGTYGYIQGALGVSAQLQRQQGLEEVLADYPGIERIAEQSANWDNAEALAIVQDMLNRFEPGEIDAIVGQGPEIVTGARNAIEGGREDVAFIAGDYPADVRAAIRDGVIFGTPNQDPAPQGEEAIRLAVEWLNGNTEAVPQPQALIEMPMITMENVEEIPAAWGE